MEILYPIRMGYPDRKIDIIMTILPPVIIKNTTKAREIIFQMIAQDWKHMGCSISVDRFIIHF